jgi:hypothetical protein
VALMAQVDVELRIDENGLQALVRGGVTDDLRRRGNKVLTRARQLAPVQTGALRGSLNMQMTNEGGVPGVRIGTPLKYAVYVHEGTGIHAGRGYIYPTSARMLAWRQFGTGQFIFAKRVAGQRANPFLLKALDAAAD